MTPIILFTYQYKDHASAKLSTGLGNNRLSYADSNGNGKIDTPGSTAVTVWKETFEDKSKGNNDWDGSGNSWGWPITDIVSNKAKSGSKSGYITINADRKWTDYYVHSNEWLDINNSKPTLYRFSGWVYVDPIIYRAQFFFFMNKAGETDYFSEVTHVETTEKGKWVFMQKTVLVKPEIKKLNFRIDADGHYTGTVWYDDLKIEQLDMSQNEIVSETNYYPFGLAHKGYNEVSTSSNLGENWKYQGQERTTDMDLNIDEWKYRVSDPAIGRFWQIDPLAEDFPHNGTYNFSENRVVDAIELEGLESYVITGRAFIPQDKLKNPTPWGKSHYFQGDNRTYYSVNSSSYRTEQSVRLDFDNNTSETISNIAAPTVGLDKNRNEIQRSEAGTAGIVSSDIAKGGVNLEFSATNKLAKKENPVTPSISGEFNITLSPNKDGSFNFNVDIPRVDGFPAYEIWVTDETNGGSFLIFGRNPIESGEGAYSLFGKGEHSGNVSGNSSTARVSNGRVEFEDRKNDLDN